MHSSFFFLVARDKRVGGAKVFGLEHPPNLDLGSIAHGIGTALGPFGCLLQRRAIPKPEADNQLLCLGEWPVGHSPFLALETDARSLRTPVQACGVGNEMRPVAPADVGGARRSTNSEAIGHRRKNRYGQGMLWAGTPRNCWANQAGGQKHQSECS